MKLFRQIRSVEPAAVVRGQYRGYNDEDGVEPGSDTETFVALRLEIDSWRWAGVPFLIRTGKKLPVTATEAVVEFNAPRGCCSRRRGRGRLTRTTCASGWARTTGSCCHLQTKIPGDELRSRPMDLDVDFDEVLGQRQEAYQRLLEDALSGDARRFGRADALEEQWRIVEPVLHDPPPVELYRRGTWGPSDADVLAAARRWLARTRDCVGE